MFALCNVMLSIAFPPFVDRQLPSVTWVVGPLLAMNTVVQAALQTSVVRLIRPLPRPVSLCLAGVLWASWAALAAGPLWLPRALWVPCLTVAVLCYSAAQLVHSPVSNALSADAAPADVRGRYIAVFQYSFAIATVVAPLLFSALFDLSSAAPWATLAALALLTVPGMLALAPWLPRARAGDGRGRTECCPTAWGNFLTCASLRKPTVFASASTPLWLSFGGRPPTRPPQASSRGRSPSACRPRRSGSG
ncbi:hypothetical protein [Streptomyces sp. 3213.3]|uniref:hypothetical protein n=1 Tax=Streptomyces sp. 3213.3 TaxID=1855348 RepID=UPI000B884E06|nr:hypothetical protein [Streptomyces sp. 3213.3]